MTEDDSKTNPFATLHHLCIVVHDIEKAVAFYRSIGIGPWVPYPPLDQFTELEMPDREGFLAIDFRYARIGPIQLQLGQPRHDDTPQRRFLDSHGEGVFHMGFVVDDVDAAEVEALRRGLTILMRGRRDDGSGFTYFDSAEAGGVTLSIRRSPPGA